MKELLPFEFDSYEVTAAVIGGEPLFVANEVAIALGYKDYRYAVRTHCKRVTVSDTPLRDRRGQVQRPNLIPESDVYRMVFRSRLPAAERFIDWLSEEVLPTIRSAGHYIQEGSGIDRNLQERSVNYAEVMAAFGKPKKKRLTATEEKVAGAFNAAMKRAGLPSQFEGRDGSYQMTPALAEILVNHLNTSTMGNKDKALSIIEEAVALQGET